MFSSWKILEVPVAVFICASVFVIVLWTAGAVYFDVGRGRWFAGPLSLLWIVTVAGLFLVSEPLSRPLLLLLAGFAPLLLWWFSQRPSHDRTWNPNFSVLPNFELESDTVTVHNVRNTEYRSLKDFVPHFETRRYRLSYLNGVDVAITYWGTKWLCHPMLMFDFGEDGRLCISIEVRYREGQRYSFLRSLYRQQEIMYVVSDERDAILKRTKYSEGHDVYLYRIQAETDEIRNVFLEYVVSTNNLVERPRWYHGLTTNCTTSIYRQRAQEVAWDWRWLFNGRIDEMLYDNGRLNSKLPFAELKKQSRINEIANQAPSDGFGDFVRTRLA